MRLRVVLGALAVAVVGLGTYAYAARPAPTPVASNTVQVQRGAVTLTASAAGTVTPAQTRGLSFSTAGTVTEVAVKPGDQVTPGQVLARMDGSAVQDDVTAAQASVDAAADALSRAGSTTTSATCQNVPAAYHPPTSSPSPSPSPSASATPPPPAPTPSRSRPAAPPPPAREPAPPARRGGSAPRQSGACGSGSGSGRSSSGDSLFSAQQQLTNAQLALTLARDKLAGTTITAPVAGRVLSVGGVVGAQQTPGGSGFIVLGGVADTAVQAEFSEADVARLAVGQPATITLPNQDGTELTGKVSQIDPAGTTSGRLVRYGVLVAFDAVPDDLLLGQSADVAVTTAAATDVLYVPSTAVSKDTVTVRVGGHDQTRKVLTGLRGDRYTEIRSGLQAGDELVLR